MRPLSRTFRLLAFGFALAQYALAGAFAVLDARIEAESYRDASVHIESPTVPCGVVHHSAKCVVCHFLGIRIGTTAQSYVVPENWVTTLIAEASQPLQAPTLTPHRRLLPRAPPSVIA